MQTDEDPSDSNNVVSIFGSSWSKDFGSTSDPNRVFDPWTKFNSILLDYMNNYMSLLREQENRLNKANRTATSRDVRDIRSSFSTKQNRRSSQQSTTNMEDFIEGKNLLTFACLAQDGNPLNNLTFDWFIGSKIIPENIDDYSTTEDINSKHPRRSLQATQVVNDQLGDISTNNQIQIYSNENITVLMNVVKRHDTGHSLNPYKMSLLTVNVIIYPTKTSRNLELQADPIVRHSVEQREASNYNEHVRSRSSMNGPKGIRDTKHHMRASGQDLNDGLQFANDYGVEIKSTTSKSYWNPLSELNEKVWLQQIDNSLKCKITNQIGKSDVCHVRVNIEERFRIRQEASSEFARWRMPSFGQKSLLIIGTLVCCALSIFAISALLISPYVRNFKTNKDEAQSRANHQANNRHEQGSTGQSTCSQKSSMLGLLSSNGDSSIQGSSDDDNSARLHNRDGINQVNRQQLTDIGRPISQVCYPHHLDSRKLGNRGELDYDLPRSNLKYETTLNDTVRETIPPLQIQLSKNHSTAPRNRLLGNLSFKSLTKFKVDRISDIASKMENLKYIYGKTGSNSDTNTTSMSTNGLGSETSIKKTSPTSTESSTFFSPSSHHQQCNSGFLQVRGRDDPHYKFNQNGLQTDSDSTIMQLNSQILDPSSITHTYSNLYNGQHSGPNVLDEFMRQRDINSSFENEDQSASSFFRSQSMRTNVTGQPMHQFYPAMVNRGPPIHPRARHPVDPYASTMGLPPPVSVRKPYQKQMSDLNYNIQNYPSNRFSMPQYNQSYDGIGDTQIVIPHFNYRDTIDTHLNRMADSVTMSRYANPSQLVSERGPISYDNSNNYSNEHIYAVNAYATPEQTPVRRRNSFSQNQTFGSERPSVSQLVQTFSSQVG